MAKPCKQTINVVHLFPYYRVHFLVRDLLSVRINVHLNGVSWHLLWLSAFSRGLVTLQWQIPIESVDVSLPMTTTWDTLNLNVCYIDHNAWDNITHFVILKLLKLSLHTIFMRAILSFQLTFWHYLIYDSSSYPNVKHTARLSKIPLKSNGRAPNAIDIS